RDYRYGKDERERTSDNLCRGVREFAKPFFHVSSKPKKWWALAAPGKGVAAPQPVQSVWKILN
ncbi:MAG TPA: hypothetical protein VGY54_12465, partial [Polyangiaceae bacterium]|nr:hypothetical protein [Polyangiaceae bacterium]